jgi:hypothetical protein
MQEPLKNFVTALRINPAKMNKAIQKHDPERDLTSWREEYFSPSFKQTEV